MIGNSTVWLEYVVPYIFWAACIGTMSPKKGQGGSKGKQSAKHKAQAQPSPLISSSDNEEWPEYTAIWEKLNALERERAQARAVTGPTEQRSSRRESKVHRVSELKNCCSRS